MRKYWTKDEDDILRKLYTSVEAKDIAIMLRTTTKKVFSRARYLKLSKRSINANQDLTHQVFGRLTVLSKSHKQRNGVHWLCRCVCGNTTVVNGNALKRGTTQSCGCLHRELVSNNQTLDLTNQVFDYLTCVKPAKRNKSGKRTWDCRCRCGNHIVVATGDLRSGTTTSCGCLKSQRLSNALSLDITGQRFGKLIAIKYAYTKNRKRYWECKCDCGNTHITKVSSLRNGGTKSCGCINSWGNHMIWSTLTQLEIDYEREKTFPGCKYYRLLRFDCYIPSLNTVVEFHGKQHYGPVRIGQFGIKTQEQAEQQFKLQVKRDTIKSEYCKQNNIRLITINYQDIDHIETILKDLIDE